MKITEGKPAKAGFFAIFFRLFQKFYESVCPKFNSQLGELYKFRSIFNSNIIG